ncbi:conjugal transfer protein TrbL family protein [Nonomuraea fuscirosea]|uniref:conjugal transfer protein TrbL family protein n=1 Tax=Nonomuraea fuscirosea TaxID=1291556 RepID=UPI003416B44D
MPRPTIDVAAQRRTGLTAVAALLARTATTAAVIAACLAGTAASAAATPSPSPVPSPSPGDVTVEAPGFGFGIGDWIAGWINSWFSNLVALAIEPMLKVLSVTLLATPDVTGNARVFDLWQASAVIANSGFILLATIGAIAAMGHGTVQTRYAIKEVLPRLLVAALAANTSFTICAKIIELANALSAALLGQNFDGRRALTTLQSMILPPAQDESFYILLALVAVILMILLLIAFVMRAAMVLLLVVAAPLALACLALPYTDGLARFWWRAFTGLLIAQVAQSLTLVMTVRIFFNQDGRLLLGLIPSGQLINLVLALCLLIILVRIPRWVLRPIFAQTAGRGSSITRIVKCALAYKLTSPVLNALHLGRGVRGRVATSAGVPTRALPPGRPPGRPGPGAPRPPAGPAPRGGPGQGGHSPTGTRRPSNRRSPASSPPPVHVVNRSPVPQPQWLQPPLITGPIGRAQPSPLPAVPGRPVPPAVFQPPIYPGNTTNSGRRTPPTAGGERK